MFFFFGCTILVISCTSLESRLFWGLHALNFWFWGQGRSGDLKVPFHFMCTCSLCHYVPDYSFSLGFRDRQTPIRVIFLAGVKQP